MKKYLKVISFVALFSLFGISSSSANLEEKSLSNVSVLNKKEKIKKANNSDNVLRVYNWEDYIYLDDDEKMTLVEEFEDEYDCTVVYDTFDTNETMLSKIKLGVSDYDLICPSDYTIQRMISEDLLVPFDEDSTPYYDLYASKYLVNKLEEIEVNGESNIVQNYARGYMWGTLGLLYNPEYDGFAEDVSETIQEDMGDWNSLWEDKYYGSFYLKDSMRDTYSVGIMRAYDAEFKALKEEYEDGSISEEEYNLEVTRLFNQSDQEASNKVFDALEDLTANGASFEIDEGKEDIQKGYIGVDVAWSGDASYAMYNADENGLSLYYQVPKTGGNIWFDGWVMPKGANKTLAEEFVDFLSRPENAIMNMDYIGYVSFIAGDDVLDYVKDNYDVSEDDTIEEKYDRDLSYLFDGTLENYDLDDCALEIEEENREFDTCYPKEEDLAHLAVMNDFGENLSIVTSGWEKYRGQSIPLWLYITSGVVVLGIIGYIIFYKIRKKTELKRRKERRAKAA